MSNETEVARPATELVFVVDETLPTGHAVNAAAVLGLSTGGRIADSLGEDGKDASGGVHLGLNTHPVPIATASREQLRELFIKAAERPDLLVVGFNEVARRARVYEEYLATLAGAVRQRRRLPLLRPVRHLRRTRQSPPRPIRPPQASHPSPG